MNSGSEDSSLAIKERGRYKPPFKAIPVRVNNMDEIGHSLWFGKRSSS